MALGPLPMALGPIAMAPGPITVACATWNGGANHQTLLRGQQHRFSSMLAGPGLKT